MESTGSGSLVRAEVPMAEMLNYGAALTSMTQGRGSFRMDMDHYDAVPQQLSEKIVATARRPVGEEAED
jgi:elongation factor G